MVDFADDWRLAVALDDRRSHPWPDYSLGLR
jgi:hypothetical protein